MRPEKQTRTFSGLSHKSYDLNQSFRRNRGRIRSDNIFGLPAFLLNARSALDYSFDVTRDVDGKA